MRRGFGGDESVGSVKVGFEWDVGVLILELERVAVSVADMDADCCASIHADGIVELLHPAGDVGCVFVCKVEESVVAGAEESEDWLLPLDAHLAWVLEVIGEGVAEGPGRGGA